MAMRACLTPGCTSVQLDAPFCADCMDHAQRDIAALVYDYFDLEQRIPRSGGGTGEVVSGSREAPLPIDINVVAMQWQIWWLLTTWEEILCDHGRFADPRPEVRQGHAVQRAVGLIANMVADLADIGPTAIAGCDEPVSGAEAIIAMRRLHAAARAFLGRNLLVHELAGHCPECRGDTLRRDDGSETVYCAACPFRATWNDYQANALAWAAYRPDDLLTPAQAAAVAGTSQAVLRVWRARGRLAGVLRDRLWWYAYADVIALRRNANIDTAEVDVTLRG